MKDRNTNKNYTVDEIGEAVSLLHDAHRDHDHYEEIVKSQLLGIVSMLLDKCNYIENRELAKEMVEKIRQIIPTIVSKDDSINGLLGL